MKIHGKLLTLCLLHPSAWEASAFSIHAPENSRYSTALNVRKDTRTRSVNSNTGRDLSGMANPSTLSDLKVSGPEGVAPLARDNLTKRSTEEVWAEAKPTTVQGGSLRTCAFNSNVERVQVIMETEGRPLLSNLDLWQGPDNAPQKLGIYLEDGKSRPFRCIIETPGSSNSVAIRNTAEMEFPLYAVIEPDLEPIGPAQTIPRDAYRRTVQGGAIYTTPFAPNVASVQCILMTDGRPLNARIELLQGPNNNKQVMDVYTEDGSLRPFVVVIDTPGVGNVIRIVNTATVEFPIYAYVEPYLFSDDSLEARKAQGPGMIWS